MEVQKLEKNASPTLYFCQTAEGFALTLIFSLPSASRDESSKDRQTVPHVFPPEPRSPVGLGLPFVARAL